jgi:hypothetical protein
VVKRVSSTKKRVVTVVGHEASMTHHMLMENKTLGKPSCWCAIADSSAIAQRVEDLDAKVSHQQKEISHQQMEISRLVKLESANTGLLKVGTIFTRYFGTLRSDLCEPPYGLSKIDVALMSG